ncbi:MAG: hypothetical protein HY062_05980 [Bacteroidetes bacterium]|nr:hypothetical protein [Bacteroidota bacterium]
MKTEKFPHEQFLEDNQIDYKTLPEMLYKRIKGFEELKEDLQHTTEEDQGRLIEKMESLSHEILEDLEDEFEGNIENNDEEEEMEEPEQTENSVSSVIEEPVVEPIPETESSTVEEPGIESIEEIETVTEAEPTIEPLAETETSSEEEASLETESAPTQEETFPEPVKELTDEEILNDFISNQKKLVSQAELRAKGFKTPLNGKVIYVGKLCLHKGKYDTCYKIIVNS